MLNYFFEKNPLLLGINSLIEQFRLLPALIDYFSNLLCKNCPKNVQKVLFGVGGISVTFFAVKFLYQQYKYEKIGILHHLFHQKLNYKEKYGSGGIIITGACHGIGWAFAEHFSQWFDLILIDIDGKKIEGRVNQLKQRRKQVNIYSLVADLSNEEGIRKATYWLKKLLDEKKLDISMVINNAGMIHMGQFLSLDPGKFNSISTLNFRAPFEINRLMIPYFRAREKHSAIVHVSSAVGVFNALFCGIYPSTKLILDIYCQNLDLEQKDKIDILSIRPFGVSTSMMGMKKNPEIIPPNIVVQSALQDLGTKCTTFGGLAHKHIAHKFSQQTEEQIFTLFLNKKGKK